MRSRMNELDEPRTITLDKQSSFGAFGTASIWLAALFSLTALGVIGLRMLNVDPEVDFSPLLLLIAYAPLLASLIAIQVSRIGFRRYWKSLIDAMRPTRSSWTWVLLALLVPLVLVLFGALIHNTLSPATSQGWFVWSAIPVGLGAVFAGSVGEEWGWRGFGQPLLQNRLSVLKTSVILGVAWATWHLWPLIDGTDSQISAVDVASTYVRLIATAIVYGWLVNRRAGLLLVMVAHASHNIAVDMFPVPDSQVATQGAILAGLYLVLAVAATVDLRTRSVATHK